MLEKKTTPVIPVNRNEPKLKILYVSLDTSPKNIGKELKNVDITSGNAAPQTMVLLKLNRLRDIQTGYCMKGLVMVAKLICQASVEDVQFSENVKRTELAIEFHDRNTEPCKNARKQYSKSKIHFVLEPEIPKMKICAKKENRTIEIRVGSNKHKLPCICWLFNIGARSSIVDTIQIFLHHHIHHNLSRDREISSNHFAV